MKKTEIIFREKHWKELINYFSKDKLNESGAIAFCSLVNLNTLRRFLVNDLLFPNKNSYRRRSPGFVGFSPNFMEYCFQRCEKDNLHLIDIHTHPFSNSVSFSPIDDIEDSQRKGPYMNAYVPGVELLFMVHGANLADIDSRIWSRETKTLEAVDLIKIF